ncbi:MAG: amidohydrolase [Anaerolineales bacterium]|nr:amidohydrolase [Anaerolineales bacterium]
MRFLHNARIYTMDEDRPTATALALDGQRILAIGGEDLLADFDPAGREDMQGQVILPGLVDAHLHLLQFAESLQRVDCETESKDECLRRVAARVQESGPGTWVCGHGWNQNNWGGEWPTAAELDAIAPRTPVYLTAKSLHAAWVNSPALQQAGITASTPDPDNGQILRDQGGQPNGILLEDAYFLVRDNIPQLTVEEAARCLDTAQRQLWQLGLTGVHDFDGSLCFQGLQRLRTDGGLKLRVVKNLPLDRLAEAVALGLGSGFGDDRLRIGSVKLFADGALGPRTAAVLEPYVDEPGNRGMLNLDGSQVGAYGRQAALSGLSLAVHAIGDLAVREVLEGFAQLRAFEIQNGLPALRHRIEHVQLIHPEDVGRLADLGLIASMQPVHAPSDMPMADRLWGARAAFAYAWQAQRQHGARLAFGSDAPVESPNPFWGLHAAVTRCRRDGSPGEQGWYPEQRLDLLTALQGFTTGPAYAAGTEGRLGRLAPGCLADLIVLAVDPFACDPADLHRVRPAATMIGGEWVWQS